LTARQPDAGASEDARVDGSTNVPYGFKCVVGGGDLGLRTDVQGGTAMGETRVSMRRILRRVIAAVAVSDVAYRLFVREPLRRALGIEVRHA
jgi:hypothetical protein